MPVSDYNLRAELQEESESVGANDETVITVSSLGYLWIKLTRRYNGGDDAGRTNYSDVKAFVVAETPYRSDVAENLRLVAGGATYRILAAYDPTGERKIMRLRLCEAANP